ncbi:hypothetical protein [Bradyrhizobium sp.]|uniref:hypothetical protein n=1 Tax=Bradyrhizobium sp. TaxID=376 RepID=UPI003C1F9154
MSSSEHPRVDCHRPGDASQLDRDKRRGKPGKLAAARRGSQPAGFEWRGASRQTIDLHAKSIHDNDLMRAVLMLDGPHFEHLAKRPKLLFDINGLQMVPSGADQLLRD